jgi:hypothetical protein
MSPEREEMTDKSQSSRATWPFAVPEFLQPLNASPLLDIQRRSIEAMTRTASKVSETMATIASKQMATLSKVSIVPPSPPAGKRDLADFIEAQFEGGRAAFETMISEMRELNDAARQCWYDVVGEFEACARDNIKSVEEQFKQPPASERGTGPAASAQQRAKSAAE